MIHRVVKFKDISRMQSGTVGLKWKSLFCSFFVFHLSQISRLHVIASDNSRHFHPALQTSEIGIICRT